MERVGANHSDREDFFLIYYTGPLSLQLLCIRHVCTFMGSFGSSLPHREVRRAEGIIPFVHVQGKTHKVKHLFQAHK